MNVRVRQVWLDHAFARVVGSAERCGVNVDGWALENGSPTYGRAWRLVRIGDHGSHCAALGGLMSDLGGTTRLGATAREALATLTGLAAAYESVASR